MGRKVEQNKEKSRRLEIRLFLNVNEFNTMRFFLYSQLPFCMLKYQMVIL